MPSLFGELKRRNVFKVAITYTIVAWLLVQVASIVLPTFDAPSWALRTLTFLLLLGFPAAIVLAWAYELTPEGIKPAAAFQGAAGVGQDRSARLDRGLRYTTMKLNEHPVPGCSGALNLRISPFRERLLNDRWRRVRSWGAPDASRLATRD
jgi:hypothetical protein